MPKRIQRKRTKGWRMPEGAVYVGRPTIYGNPFGRFLADDQDRLLAVQMFRAWWEGHGRIQGQLKYPDQMTLLMGAMFQTEPHPLEGHDLACWCPEGSPCHADVLLELANA